MENKKIRLHPFKNGKEDKDVNLYPETSIDAVNGLDNALNDKQDKLNQNQLDAVNSGVTANKIAEYDTLQGQIDSKQGELTPSEQSAVDSGITSEKVAQYDAYANEIAGKQNIINDLDSIRSGASLGASAIQPTDELKNLLYETKDLKRINFNVNDYVQYLNPNFNYYLYSHYGENQRLYLNYNSSAEYISLYITAYIDNLYKSFYFVFDLTNNQTFGSWRNQSSYSGNEWSSEDLEKLKFVYHGYTPSSERYLTILKAILKNEDGSEVSELVEGNTYKLNPNVNEYRDIIDSFTKDDKYNYLYQWTNDDSVLRSIEIYSMYYTSTPYFEINTNPSKEDTKYYYLFPKIGSTTYPGIWADSSSYSWSEIHYYTSEELENIVVEIDEQYKNPNLTEDGEALFNAIVVDNPVNVSLEDRVGEMEEEINSLLYDKNYGLQSYIQFPINWRAFVDEEGQPISTLLLYQGEGIEIQEDYLNENSVYAIAITQSTSLSTNIRYVIFSDNYINEDSFEFVGNSWYKIDSSSPQPVEVSINEINISFKTDYVLDDLCYEVIGFEMLSLEGKFNEVEYKLEELEAKIDDKEDDTLLKDKIYDEITSDELIEGQLYQIKDTLDGFFDKGYATGYIYEPGYVPPTPGAMILNNLSGDIPASDIPSPSTDSYEYISEIYLDRFINRYFVLLYTSNSNEYRYYSDGNKWTINGNDADITNLRLELNTSNIRNEQALKDILLLTKEQTLEEKFNEIEEQINKPLKEQTYEHIEESYTLLDIPNWEDMGDALSDWYQVYSYIPSGSEFANMIYLGEDRNYASHSGVFLTVVDENSQSKNYAIFNEDWTDSQEGQGFEVKANTWYKVTYDYDVIPYIRTYEEEIPNLIINNEGIENIDLFKCVYNYQEEQTITLGEVVEGNLKDKTYDTIPETYKLLTPNWENITFSGEQYHIYQAGSYPYNYEENYCFIGYVEYGYEIETYETDEIYKIAFDKVIGFDQNSEPIFESYYNLNKDCVVGYGSSQQLTKGVWYKGTYNEELDYTIFEEVDNIEMLFHEDYIVEEYKDLFNQLVQYIPEQKITLDEKLKYLITDYTEDNGALTSITVKDKETGEPTTLVVGGGKQSYQHNIVIARKNDNYSRVSVMIPNDDPTEFTYASLLNWLYTKGFIYKDQNAGRKNNPYLASGGWTSDGSSYYAVSGVLYNVHTNEILIRGCGSSGLTGTNASSTTATYEDTVIPL